MSAGLPYSLASWLISHTKSELLSTGASSTKPTAAQGIFYFICEGYFLYVDIRLHVKYVVGYMCARDMSNK